MVEHTHSLCPLGLSPNAWHFLLVSFPALIGQQDEQLKSKVSMLEARLLEANSAKLQAQCEVEDMKSTLVATAAQLKVTQKQVLLLFSLPRHITIFVPMRPLPF